MTSKKEPKIAKIPSLVKTLFLQPIPHENTVFAAPDTPESDQKINISRDLFLTPFRDPVFLFGPGPPIGKKLPKKLKAPHKEFKKTA